MTDGNGALFQAAQWRHTNEKTAGALAPAVVKLTLLSVPASAEGVPVPWLRAT